MSFLQILINSLATIVDTLLWLLFFIILIRVLISWVSPDPYNPLVRTLYQISDPILRPAQRLIPPMGGLDLSPIVVLLAISFLRRAIEFLRIFLIDSL